MIQNDGLSIPDNYLEEWSREIARWVNVNLDNMFARNVMPVRKVDEAVQIDVVVDYDRTGPGAKVVAKGSTPTGKTGIKQTTTKQDILQFMDWFSVHEKDLKSNPAMFNRYVDICLDNIHRLEDSLTINGDASLGIIGIVAAAQANANGKIAAADNAGVWGSATQDPHADIVKAKRLLDGNYKSNPLFLIGNSLDMEFLFNLDSMRQPFYKTIAPLFRASPDADPYGTWLKINDGFAEGKVYLAVKNPVVAEFVVSENPYPDRLPKAAGGNFPVELKGWAVPRIYKNEGFVEIEVGTTA